MAVSCVYFGHLVSTIGNPSFLSLARFGVLIFFVHTSLVLMESLDRLDPTAGSNSRLFGGFWVRRIFRIYPLAMLTVVLVVLFHVPYIPGQVYGWIGAKAFLSNLFLVQNLTLTTDIIGPLWSLPLEVQMYILLPFAYLAIRGRRYRSLFLWVLSVILAMTLPRLSPRLNVFYFAPCFTSGIVAYDLVRSRLGRWKLPSWTWPLGICIFILLFGPHDNELFSSKFHRAWATSLLLGILYANVRELPAGVIQRLTHWIAEHSYGIYLSHMIIMWVAVDRMHAKPLWFRVLFLVTTSIAVPALLYVSIEKPFILIGQHVARGLLRTRPKDSATSVVLPVLAPDSRFDLPDSQ